MFDFTNYTFSASISIFGVIIGLAYPFLLQAIQRIDDQYNSLRLSARIQKETTFIFFKVILFSNIIISILAPYALYICESRCSIIVIFCQTAFVSALLFKLFSLFNLICEYYDPSKLIARLKSSVQGLRNSKMTDLKQDKAKKLIQDLGCLLDVSVYGDKRNDFNIYAEAYGELLGCVFEYQRQSERGIDLIYPGGFISLFAEISHQSCASKGYFYYRNQIIPALYNTINRHVISRETLLYIWQTLNDIIKADNKVWFIQYWGSADQYYRTELAEPNCENGQNKAYQENFYELHLMVGALLCYNKKFHWLRIIMFFTNEAPPSYELVPSTFIRILDEYKKLSDVKPCQRTTFMSYRYTFKGINQNVNIEGFIYNVITTYFALLVIRLFLVNDYNITFSNPMSLPTVSKDEDYNSYYIKLIAQLKGKVEFWYESKDIEFVNLAIIPPKEGVLELLERCIEKFDNANWDIRKSKEGNPFKEKGLKDKLLSLEPGLMKTIITDASRIGDSCGFSLIEGENRDSENFSFEYSYELKDNRLFNGYINYHVNLPEMLLHGLFSQIQRHYINKFTAIKSRANYLIRYSDRFKAIDNLKLDANKHVILLLGIYLENPEQESDTPTGLVINSYGAFYNMVPLISIASNEYSLLILNKSDLPFYEFQSIEETVLRRISEDSFLYSNIDELNKDNRILHLKYSLKYYHKASKDTIEYIRVIISGNLPIGSSGDLYSIEPFSGANK